MTTLKPMFDAKAAMKELGEFNSRMIKGAELLSEIDEIDVGTTP